MARRALAAAGATLVLLAALLAGCAPPDDSGDWASVREITPAFLIGRGAHPPVVREAVVAADGHGRVALTWVTSDLAGSALWLSVSGDSGATFAPAVRVDTGRLGSNQDLEFGPGGALAIAWSEMRRDSTRAVDLRVRASADGGATLGPAATVNDDVAGMPPGLSWRAARRWLLERNPAPRHGPASLAFLPDGSLLAAWIDDRQLPSPRKSPLFYAVSLDGGQTWSPNASLTDSACACCRPSAVTDARGHVALAYRRCAGLVADPALALSLDGGRTFASDTTLSSARWTPDCPDESPALTWNRAGGGHYAWATLEAPATAYVVPWREATGVAGLRRAIVDSLVEARHPSLAALGTTTLIGVEGRPRGRAAGSVFAVRGLELDGTLTPWIFLGVGAHSGRLAGASPRSAYACWIEPDGAGSRLRVVRIVKRAFR